MNKKTSTMGVMVVMGLSLSGSAQTQAQGNIIAGNVGDGIFIEGTSDNNTISQNVITANGAAGVVIGANDADLSVGNAILSNSIFANAGIGIDLGNDGITLNHATSPTAGPNNFQNYPVIFFVSARGIVQASLQSVPSSTFLIQFFQNDTDARDGKELVGSLTVFTDAAGNVSFTYTLQTVTVGDFITATATRIVEGAATDTSEFSAPVQVSPLGESLSKLVTRKG